MAKRQNGAKWIFLYPKHLHYSRLIQMQITEPQSAHDFEGYYELRWRILRAPWKEPRGSEKDGFEEKAYHLMARTEEGTLAGVGRMHLIEPQTVQIRFMAVDEPFRGKGVGKLILSRLETEARSRGALKVFLHARAEVSDFYRKAGYSVTGPGPTLFGHIRHFVMEKKLG
jgi:GNAT superfamily N-acetyltransferase